MTTYVEETITIGGGRSQLKPDPLSGIEAVPERRVQLTLVPLTGRPDQASKSILARMVNR